MSDKADIARLRAAGKVGRRLFDGNKSPTAEERSQILNEIAIDYCVQCDALAARLDGVNSMLYRAVRELEYAQSVENCNSGLCASAEGRDVVEAGMKLLGVADLSGDTLATTKMLPKERP